jgi:hypothetical protein
LVVGGKFFGAQHGLNTDQRDLRVNAHLQDLPKTMKQGLKENKTPTGTKANHRQHQKRHTQQVEEHDGREDGRSSQILQNE